MRFGEADFSLHRLFRARLVERRRTGLGAGAGEADAAPLHHPLHGAVLPLAAVQPEEEEGVVDGKRVEGLLERRPRRRPRRLVVELEGALVREEVGEGDVVDGAVRRPEPSQDVAEGADDVLRRGDGDVALVGAPAEEDDGGHQVLRSLVLRLLRLNLTT